MTKDWSVAASVVVVVVNISVMLAVKLRKT